MRYKDERTRSDILELLQSGDLTSSGIAVRLSIVKSVVRNELHALFKSGFIDRTGPHDNEGQPTFYLYRLSKQMELKL